MIEKLITLITNLFIGCIILAIALVTLLFLVEVYPVTIAVISGIILDKFLFKKVSWGKRFILWVITMFMVMNISTEVVFELTGYKYVPPSKDDYQCYELAPRISSC